MRWRHSSARGCGSRYAEAALITLNRISIEQRSLLADELRNAPILVWRFGPRRTGYVPNLRKSVRRRQLGLSRKYSLRGDVGRGACAVVRVCTAWASSRL